MKRKIFYHYGKAANIWWKSLTLKRFEMDVMISYSAARLVSFFQAMRALPKA